MIKKLYLQLDTSSSHYHEKASSFVNETNFITEYISRDIAKLKLKYEKANQLIIEIDSKIEEAKYHKTFTTVGCCIFSEYEELEKLNETQWNENILTKIKEAVDLYKPLMPSLVPVIHGSIDAFREGSYENIWLFKKRRITGIGTAKLICELDREQFVLSLVIENKTEEVYRKIILKELPDSLSYHHRFKDIKIEKDNIYVIDRHAEEPFFCISIKDMQERKDGSFLDTSFMKGYREWCSEHD